MRFAPDRTLKEKRISLIEKIPDGVILTKVVGREEIELNPHAHNIHQIIYTISGTLHIEVDGVSYFAPDRHIVWIPASVRHRLSSNNMQISLLVSYFRAETDIASNQNLFSVYMADGMVDANMNFISRYRRVDKLKDPRLYSFISGFYMAVPSFCKRVSITLQPYALKKDSRIMPILDYIRANMSCELTVPKLASYFGVSTRSLTRMFTDSGIRFVQYLHYLRVVRAIEILSENTMNIEQTAYEVGFNSPNSFNRVFRQITGESPSVYMMKHR